MYPIPPRPRPEWKPLVIAESQPEYIPLPANTRYPYVETRWKLGWGERLRLLWTGELHLVLMTFGRALQPLRPSVDPVTEKELGYDPEPKPEPGVRTATAVEAQNTQAQSKQKELWP